MYLEKQFSIATSPAGFGCIELVLPWSLSGTETLYRVPAASQQLSAACTDPLCLFQVGAQRQKYESLTTSSPHVEFISSWIVLMCSLSRQPCVLKAIDIVTSLRYERRTSVLASQQGC